MTFLRSFAKIRYYKKKQVNNKQIDFEFEINNNKEYKINSIQNSIVYTKESITG